MPEPKRGDKATCENCGKEVVYVGPHWKHPGLLQPRHPAWPAKSTQEAVITITVQKGENGQLTSQHEIKGIDELTGALILFDVARDIMVAHAQRPVVSSQ